MKNLVSNVFKSEHGGTLIEYALVGALIAVVVISGIIYSSTSLTQVFTKLYNAF